LQEVKQSHHVSDRIGLLSQLAEEAAAAREWPAVIARYQEALRECGYCNSAVELHKALGITYCQVGRLASAEHELRIALQLRPDDTRTSQTLELIRAAGEGAHKE
jgi:Flp pilus assembly protein TadD